MADDARHRKTSDTLMHKEMSRDEVILTCEQLIMDQRVYFSGYATLYQKFRLMADSDFAATDINGRSLVFIASFHGNSQILQLLLDEVSRRQLRFLVHVPSFGFSPLMIASQLGRLDCVKLLVEAGANCFDYTSAKNFRASAFDLAIVHGQDAILNFFLSTMVIGNAKLKLQQFKQTWKYEEQLARRRNKPLHLAVEMQSAGCAQSLIKAGYPVDAVDFWPLENYSCGSSNSVCVDGDCPANEETLYKITELTLAVDTRNLEAVIQLMQAGANANGVAGTVPPICCVFHPTERDMNVALLQLLLTFGARLDIISEARVSFCHRFWITVLSDYLYVKLALEYGLELSLYFDSDIIRTKFFEDLIECSKADTSSEEGLEKSRGASKTVNIVSMFLKRTYFDGELGARLIDCFSDVLARRFVLEHASSTGSNASSDEQLIDFELVQEPSSTKSRTVKETPNSLKDLCRLLIRRHAAVRTVLKDSKGKRLAFPFIVEQTDMKVNEKRILLFKDFEGR